MMRSNIRNIVAIVVGLALLLLPLFIIRASFEISRIGDMPAIEQLRSDMPKITGTALEDAIGQATIWNQKIQTLRAYNNCFWADPFIPDDWDKIALIPMPGTINTHKLGAIFEKLKSNISQLRLELAQLTQKVESHPPFILGETREPR